MPRKNLVLGAMIAHGLEEIHPFVESLRGPLAGPPYEFLQEGRLLYP
jgi:hypothetical protein